MFKTNILIDLKSYLNISDGMLFQFILYIPFSLVILLPVFITLKVRRQNFSSIGLKSDKALKSIILGIVFSIPLVIPSIISSVNRGMSLLSLPNLILLFLYFLLEIALVEELSFRGFIQTRIQGLIKVKWLSIVIVGIMFALMHIPFQMLLRDMKLVEFIKTDAIHLITTFVIHIYLVFLYTRDDNIICPTVAHLLINFVPSMFM